MIVLRPLLSLVVIALALAAIALPAPADEIPFPKGESRQMLAGLGCSVLVPEQEPPPEGYSLVVALHTHDDDARSLVKRFRPHQERGCIVIAPDWRPDGSQKEQMVAVRNAVDVAIDKLAIPVERRHFATREVSFVAMAWLVFDREPRFATACWLNGARPGGRVPDHARESLSLLVLVGDENPHAKASRSAVNVYGPKVRSVEIRTHAGNVAEPLQALVPYHAWWIKTREGRFRPGDSLAFTWNEWKPGALANLSETGSGGFVYWYSSEKDSDSEAARRFQNDVLHHPLVQHYGQRLTAWSCDRKDFEKGFDGARLKTTPAVIVFDSRSRHKATLEGEITAEKLAAAFRSAAGDKSPPE